MSVCVPFKNEFYYNKKIKIFNSVKCKNEKIKKRFSGTSKEQIYEVNKNNISYIEYFKIPKKFLKCVFIKPNETKFYKKGNITLEDLLKEINFHSVITGSYPNLAPKIKSINVSKENDLLKVQVISESASKGKYKKIGDCIDSGKLNIKFHKTNCPIDKKLLNYIKSKEKVKHLDHEFYARFLNPKYITQNLETWYKKNKKFFDAFFKDLNKLHKLDIFHHDLHLDNIWVTKDYNFKFLDFGRSCNKKEALKIETNLNSKLKKLQHAEKYKIKKFLKTDKLKALMLIELNNQENVSIGFEFMRHDIDEGVIMQCFDREPMNNSYYYKNILLVYKHFLSEKYKQANQ